ASWMIAVDRFLLRSTTWSERGCLRLFLRRGQVLDEGEFSARLESAEVHLIHERADEEDTAAGAAQEIFGGEGIWEVLPIDTFALVGDGEDEGFPVIFEAGRYLFGGVVIVSMQNGVDGGLANRHGDAE